VTSLIPPSLLNPYATLAVAIALAAALGFFGQQRLTQAQHLHLSTQHQLSRAHAALAEARSEAARLPAYAALYRQLQQQVIGAHLPDRAAWLESIRPLTLQLDYELLPTRALPPRLGLTPILHPFHTHFAVLHELRLFDVLTQLRSQGWLWLEHCTVEPGERATRLAVECEGGWLTLPTL
jgi:hypothetical protein